jgi:hypothetical protein
MKIKKKDCLEIKKVKKLLINIVDPNDLPIYIFLTHLINEYKKANFDHTIHHLAVATKFYNDINQASHDIHQFMKGANREDLGKIVNNLINVFRLNIGTKHFARYIRKNLNSDYESTVQAHIEMCKCVDNIINLLKRLLPGNVDRLVILLNQLLH